MLVEDSRIRINAEGEECPVQDLAVADRIFDPLTEGYDSIIDIHRRRVQLCDQRSRALTPVLIEKGQLFSGAPRHDLRLSPWQLVMMVERKRAANAPMSLSCYPAKDISNDRIPVTGDITYYAIFFERHRFLDVSGVLLKSYTLEETRHN